MPVTHVDPATGNLVVAGRPVFPLGLSDPPPVGATTPSGAPAWREIAAAGVNFARDYAVWSAATVAERLLEVGGRLDNAQAHGVHVWLALAGIDDDLTHRALVDQVVATVKAHPALGVWKGADEPAHGRVPAAGLAAFHAHLKSIDPSHPLAIIEAPRDPAPANGARDRPLTAAGVRPYAAACDIHGVDIYPVSIPPGAHAGGPPVHTDIGVVGDVTRIVATATGRKAIWTTLQIAWSGTLPPHPVVFPTLQQARFMAYDAIIAGARGLFFFGGHLTQAMSARDRGHGWNWTYWQNVQRPLVEELSGPAHRDALLAAPAGFTVSADAPDVLVAARETADAIHVIAARRGTATSRVRFSGLPAAAGNGTVLAHGPGNPARPVAAHGGAFTDPSPYAPHNARVYRFPRR